MKTILILLLSLIIISCSEDDATTPLSSSGSGDADSNLEIELRGSNVSSSKRSINSVSQLPVECNSFFVPACDDSEDNCLDSAGPKAGSCITPISVTGNIVSINLTGNYYGGGIRLLGGGSGMGQNFTMEGQEFDIEDPTAIEGEDNAQDTDFDEVNTKMTMELNYLDVKFAVPRTIESVDATRFWTLRYVFVSYPFTDLVSYLVTANDDGTNEYEDSGDTIGQCLEADTSSASDTADDNNEELLGGVSAYAGDILVCRKTSEAESCDSDDFEWFNTNTETFVSTRPSSNSDVHSFKMLTGFKASCVDQGSSDGFSVDLGGFSLTTNLYKNIQFSADVEASSKIYEMQYEDDEDSYVQGDEMYLYVDIDVEKSLFVYDMINEDEDMTLDDDSLDYSNFREQSDGDLLRMIWFKPIFLWHNSNCTEGQPGDCEDSNTGVKSYVNFDISGNTDHPVYVCADDSGSDVDCVADETASSK